MTNIELFIQLLPAAVLGLIFLSGLRRPTDRHLQLFARLYSIPLTVGNVPVLRHHIRRARRFRSVGAILGLVFSLVGQVADSTSTDEATRLPLVPIIIGYGLGAIVGQLAVPRPDGVGRASLERRQITDFVRPWVFVSAGFTLTIAATLVVLRRSGSSYTDASSTVEPTGFFGTTFGWQALLVLFVAAFGAVAAKRIVDQPAPAVTTDVEAATHATRSAALMSLSGVLMLLAWALVEAVGGLYFTFPGSPNDVINVWAVVSLFVASFTAVAGLFLTIRSLPRWSVSSRNLPQLPSGSAQSLSAHGVEGATGIDGATT